MLIRIDGADALAVSLSDVKAALLVDFDDDDATLTGLILAETQRYELFTRRIIAPGNFEATFRRWDEVLTIDADRIASIVAVDYYDEGRVRRTLGEAHWRDEPVIQGAAVRITGERPDLGDVDWPVRVAFRIEGGGSSGDVSASIEPMDRAAIIHMVRHQYLQGEVLTEQELRMRFGARRRLV